MKQNAIVKLNYNPSAKRGEKTTVPVHQQFTTALTSYVVLNQDKNGSGLSAQ